MISQMISEILQLISYGLYNTVRSNAFILLILLWILGFLIILGYTFLKIIGYLEQTALSIDSIFTKEDALIHLPKELKDVEDKLNTIKYTTLRNEQLAKEAEQRKNDLVVYLAHDLKTPLTSIIGYLSLLNEAPDMPLEQKAKYTAISLDKALRLEDLINEFFEITRFNLQNIILEKSKINLNRMLEQLVDEFYPMLAPKKLTSSLVINQDIVITGDANKLARVFDNLYRNAIHYSFEGSQIEIVATKDAQGVTLRFRNHGKDIPKHRLSNIFEQFYRVDAARTSTTGGSGLGLAIAKEIIELHQGSIFATSENQKIEFRIFLPAEM